MNKLKNKYKISVLILLIVLSLGVIFYLRGQVRPMGKEQLEAVNPPTVEERADRIVNKMSDAEKIGQLMMIGVKGTAVNDDITYMINEYHMGGIILFDRNLSDKAQVKSMTKGLQHLGGDVPLFIAIDQEGGAVIRMRQELTAPPAAAVIGANGSTSEAEKWAKKTAAELKELGINVNFAPVADVGGHDGRSYSEDPGVVTSFVRAAANGYAQSGMLYSLKHFPGIGKGGGDSHIDSSVIKADKSLLIAEDLSPFRTLVAELNPEDYFIMVSHLTYLALDEKQPASLSPIITNNLLRGEMGFQGIIITDDMEMGAVSRHYDFDVLGVKAVQAGADIVLVCHEYEHEVAVYNGMLRALENGELDRRKIDESVRKIIRMKLKKCRADSI